MKFSVNRTMNYDIEGCEKLFVCNVCLFNMKRDSQIQTYEWNQDN